MIKYKNRGERQKHHDDSKEKKNVIDEHFKTQRHKFSVWKLNRPMRFSLILHALFNWIWKARNPHPRLGIQGSVARLVLTRDNV